MERGRPIGFKYQWLICGADGNACHDISGATSQTYQLTKNDSGNTVRVKVDGHERERLDADDERAHGADHGNVGRRVPEARRGSAGRRGHRRRSSGRSASSTSSGSSTATRSPEA